MGIGQDEGFSGRVFDGKLDDARVYSRVLSAGEMATLSGVSSAAREMTIAIAAVNDAPTAVTDTATAIEAGGLANGTAGTNPTGNVLTNDTDGDTGDTKTVSGVAAGVQALAATNVGTAVTGTYGSINIAANGAYTYTVDNSNVAVQALRTSGHTLSDVYTYTMRDTAGLTSTTQITVTIQGANDTPSDITGSLTIAENSVNTASVGTLNRVDIDSGDGATWALTDNAGGRFAINNATGQVTVTNSSLLNFEANASHTIVAQVTDNAGATFSKTMTISVTDVNEAPIDVTLGSAPMGLTTAGNASLVSGTTYQLTPNLGSQVGGVWGNVNLNQDFVVTSRAFFGANNGGAEGLAFVLQNQSSTSLGGAFTSRGANITGAFGVQFDTWFHGQDNEINSDFSQFFRQGAVNNQGTGFDLANAHDNLEDGLWRDLVVSWNATPVTTARLMGSRLTDIRQNLSWTFDDTTVLIENRGQPLPPDLVQELLLNDTAPNRVEAAWRYDEKSGVLRLSDVTADGQKIATELVIPIKPAGHVRVNLGNRQYNLFRMNTNNP
jgi:VCBS repeat-containing protein